MGISRRLDKLQKARGRPSCPECREFTVRFTGGLPQKPRRDGTIPENPPEPPDHCPNCGREIQKYTIRMVGLAERSRGDGSSPSLS